MKNLSKLGLIFGIGTMSALSFTLGACSDDTETPGGTAGTGTAGTGTGGTSAGTGTGGTSAGTGTGGTSAGTGTGGSSAGSGTGGSSAGSGGSAAGSGGSTAGSGGSGGAAGGGGAGGGGGAPSGPCATFCQGADSVLTICAGMLNEKINTEAKCLETCAKPASAMEDGVSCWNEHVANAKNMPDQKTLHCGHANGMDPCDPLP